MFEVVRKTLFFPFPTKLLVEMTDDDDGVMNDTFVVAAADEIVSAVKIRTTRL